MRLSLDEMCAEPEEDMVISEEGRRLVYYIITS